MCGIVGFVGREEAAPILLDGLSRLEYRGYDSAGIAVYGEGRACRWSRPRAVCRCSERSGTRAGKTMPRHTGHWATPAGPPTGSHQTSTPTPRSARAAGSRWSTTASSRITWSCGSFSSRRGFTFVSQTDTEVVAQLLEYYYRRGYPGRGGARSLHRIQGAYALGIVCADCPDRLIAARKDSPLILGYGEGAHYLASDVTALIKYTREVCYLDDGEIAELTADAPVGL